MDHAIGLFAFALRWTLILAGIAIAAPFLIGTGSVLFCGIALSDARPQ